MLTGAQPGLFRGRGGFLELGHFDKRFMYDIQKKDSAGKNFGVFLQYLLNCILNENSTHICTQTGHAFLKLGHFFAKSGHISSIFKNWQGRPQSSDLLVPVNWSFCSHFIDHARFKFKYFCFETET